jgi:hypothetical protein
MFHKNKKLLAISERAIYNPYIACPYKEEGKHHGE